jgi:hypothetical protein
VVESAAVNGKGYVADEIPLDDVTVRVWVVARRSRRTLSYKSEIDL